MPCLQSTNAQFHSSPEGKYRLQIFPFLWMWPVLPIWALAIAMVTAGLKEPGVTHHCSVTTSTLTLPCLSLYAIIMAVEIWSHEIQGSELLLCSDNGATCYWINKMCSDIPAAMALLHHLTLHCLFFQIHVSAQHLSSSANRKSDLVSHCCMAELFHEFPEMKRRPEPLLLLLWPLTWSQEEMLPPCKN